MHRRMRENRTGADNNPAVAEQPPVRCERDSTQRHHDLHPRQRGDLRDQMRVAASDLLGCRLVVRGRAAHCGRDEGVDERQAVLRMS
jgi:hypothetical protein